MKWSRFPGAHGISPDCSRRAISAPSVTAVACPTTVTLHPACPATSTLSASNATTAPRVAAASLLPAPVLITMPPSSSAKLTSSTAGSACRVYTIRPTGTEPISRRHSSRDRCSSTGP